MKIKKLKLLEKIAELDKKNQKLFEAKTKLKIEICWLKKKVIQLYDERNN